MNSDARRRSIVKWGLITSLANRGAIAIVPLLMIPLALDHLGATNYGVWTATVSLTSIVVFADLGIGVGLMTKLGAIGTDAEARSTARKLIASGYLATLTIAIALLGALLAIGAAKSWSTLLGITNLTDTATADAIILVTLAATCVNIPLSLVVRIQYGLGEQARSNVWQIGASFFALGAAIAMTYISEGPTWFVAAIAFSPPLFSFLNTATFLHSRRGSIYRPDFARDTTGGAIRLLRVGAPFLAISILMTISMSLDPWIVSRSLGSSSVAEFVIPQRIFLALTGIAITVGAPLWPVYSRAVVTGDYKWISKMTARLAAALVLSTSILAAATVVLAPAIIRLWLDSRIEFNAVLWISLAVFAVIQSAASPLFMVQNGGSLLRPQLWGYGLFAVLSLPAKMIYGPAIGGSGIVIIGVVGYLLIMWPACIVGYRQTIRKSRSNGLNMLSTP